jgi:hypothetical protein
VPITDFSNVAFTVEDGHLVMSAVARTTGKPYRHACPLASFEAVAHAIDEAGKEGITREAIHERTQIPWTRISVALLFMYERGCVERAGRKGRLYVPASTFVFEDAMTEYHALAHHPDGANT